MPEAGKAGSMAESAGDFLAKAEGVYEGAGYWFKPLEGGILYKLATGFKGEFLTGAKGGLLVALGITFTREFITGGGA